MQLIKTSPVSFILFFHLFFDFSAIWAQNGPLKGEVVLNIGHQERIKRLHFVNQDKYFMSIDDDALLNIWDVATGKTLYVIEDSTIGRQTRFIPAKEPHLLNYDYYRRKCQLNLQTGKIKIEALPPARDYLESIPLDNDPPFSKSLAPPEEKEAPLIPSHPQYDAKTAKDGHVEVWSNKEAKMLRAHDFPTEKIEVFTFNQAGNLLLLSDRRHIWLWDWKQDKVLYTCADFLYAGNPHDIAADFSAVMPDGKVYFLRGRSDPYLKSLDLHTGAERYVSMPNVSSNRFKKNGEKILAQVQGMNIHGYRSVLEQLIYPFPPNMNFFTAIKATHASQNLAFITAEGKRFMLWDAKNQQEKYALEASDKFYQFFLDDTDYLMAMVNKQSIDIYEVSSGQLIQKIPYQAESPDRLHLYFFPDSKKILIADPLLYQVSIWDLEAKRQLNNFELQLNINKFLGISTTDELIYTQNGRVIVAYDFTGRRMFHYVFSDSDVDAHYFPAEKKIIAATNNGIVYAFDALNGQLEKQIYLGEGGSWLARSRDGKVETSTTGLKYLSYRDQMGKIAPLPVGSYQIRNSGPTMLSAKPYNDDLTLKPLDPIAKAEPNHYALINLAWSVKLETDTLKPKNTPFSSHFSPYYHIESGFFSADERLVIVETTKGAFMVERESGRIVKNLPAFSSDKIAPILTPDNRYFIYVKQAHEIVLTDLWGLQADRRIQLPEHEVTALILEQSSLNLLLGTNRGYLLQYRLSDLMQTKSLKLSVTGIKALTLKTNDSELAAADEESNIHFVNLKELKIKNVLNRASQGEIINLHFHPSKPLLYVVAGRKVFGLNYTQPPFATTFQFPKSTFYQKIYFNAAMPDRMSYYTSEYRENRVITYDCIKQQKIDSSAAIRSFYGISPSGRYRLEKSTKSAYVVDVQTQKVSNIGTPQATLQQIYLHGDTLYYNAKFSEGTRLYGIQLPESQTLLEVPNYKFYGQLTQEHNRMVASGHFSSEKPGHGKKILPDSSFSWFIKNQEYIQNLWSWNGVYCGLKIPQNDTLYIYNQVEEKLIAKIYAGQNKEVSWFCIANNGRWVGLRFWRSKDIDIYDLETQTFSKLKDRPADQLFFSFDNRYLIYGSNFELQAIDFQNDQVIERVSNPYLLENKIYLRFMQKFGLIASEQEPYQLWNLERNQKLGNLYFYDAQPAAPHWVFVAQDGRYDGAPAALKNLYEVEPNKLRSQTVNPQTDSRYTPGLLLRLLKE